MLLFILIHVYFYVELETLNNKLYYVNIFYFFKCLCSGILEHMKLELVVVVVAFDDMTFFIFCFNM